ncbi:MAG: D-aminoacylase [Desulfarculaceae bacterium]|jgi:N-acyl-D-amino-acid deacylase
MADLNHKPQTISQCDLLFKGATVVDGSGGPRFTADVAVEGDTIFAVGELDPLQALSVVDASGKVLAPGFIDSHSHDDHALLADPSLEFKVSQGVTTVVVGNCGASLAPRGQDPKPLPSVLKLIGPTPEYFRVDFKSYFQDLSQNPPAVNVIALAGHTTLRWATMERLDREATPGEVKAMQKLLEQALDQGAAGLSTGLYYEPAQAATLEELIPLGEVVGQFQGIYASHIRNEGDEVMAALEEALAIGTKAKVPVIISHHKVAGKKNFGRSRQTLELIDRASRQQALGLDAYPYTASSTELNWRHVESGLPARVAWSEAAPWAAGRDLHELTAEKGWSIREAVNKLKPAIGIYFSMDQGDLCRILAYPGTMIGSDGLVSSQMPHPRLWGTFPRVLGKYCREERLFSLEEAVHKMTGLPARRWGLRDRGLIAAGNKADLVLFDPAQVRDRADYSQPARPAQGIAGVWVNGQPVWDGGFVSNLTPGRALLRGQELGEGQY